MTSDFFDISHAARLLVLDQDEEIRDQVCGALREEGFDVKSLDNGLLGWDLLQCEEFELIVLDRKLPGISGFDLCRKLRMQNNQALILMTSSLNTEADRVLGLEVGADDYLVKPFGYREFLARCRALLRRHPLSGAALKGTAPEEFQCCDLKLFPDECRACRDGCDLKLSPKEYKLLELFMQNPKRVWSRDELLDKIWGVDYIGDKKTVDVHIRWLREKIEINPSSPSKIFTVRGFGYRFC
ncbi:alkaline phosphatase [Synechococcus sp. WH 8020]|uniref:response regulator transcription factor n=1 Tax=Synechococcus sp. (strain WH8020) TaxID=32052 RepID=UPI000652668C|nr:response regulator transcription factor [Synechococcus sp. WH 8020]AKN60562.1 alkaline phosphatase [Synechococcus sp. WH 8020]